jgi:hypothetical protein
MVRAELSIRFVESEIDGIQSWLLLYRSYFEGLDRGYLTPDPSQYHDPNVCAPYLNPPANSSKPR